MKQISYSDKPVLWPQVVTAVKKPSLLANSLGLIMCLMSLYNQGIMPLNVPVKEYLSVHTTEVAAIKSL